MTNDAMLNLPWHIDHGDPLLIRDAEGLILTRIGRKTKALYRRRVMPKEGARAAARVMAAAPELLMALEMIEANLTGGASLVDLAKTMSPAELQWIEQARAAIKKARNP